jgi:hypothetical protein
MSLSYFLAGAVAFIASWALTGCRVGNHTEQPESPDKTSGYYETQPQSLTYCGTHGQTSCADASTNHIPDTVSQVMSNPVALILRDLDTGQAAFASAYGDGRSALPIYVDTATGNLSFIGNTTPSVVWRDKGCTESVYIEQGGVVTKATAAKMSGKLRIVGRIAVKIQLITTFDGDCAQTMQVMAACYADFTQCGGTDATDNRNLQAAVQETFQPYIDAGTMTGADIATTSSLAYQVSYE